MTEAQLTTGKYNLFTQLSSASAILTTVNKTVAHR
ncbi:hypothetical protein Goe25_00670 [Bacillus phage vB_BsuM-Goe25]|nr:hypothetical protein Goe25_00670 [Bacillus phage vB_BsuM-Goe25]